MITGKKSTKAWEYTSHFQLNSTITEKIIVDTEDEIRILYTARQNQGTKRNLPKLSQNVIEAFSLIFNNACEVTYLLGPSDGSVIHRQITMLFIVQQMGSIHGWD